MRVVYSKILLVFIAVLMLSCVNIQAQQGSFGWIDIAATSKSSGAAAYIDGVFVSTIPAKIKAPAGKHVISIKKEHYESFEQTYDITSDKTLCLYINLVSIGRAVKFTTAESAELWIDNTLVSNGSWSGFLAYGKHRIESRAPMCEAKILEIDFTAASKNEYVIPSPKPICGSAYITSSVDGATVKVDGRNVGITPVTLEESLTLGQHFVEVILEGNVVTGTIDVVKDEMTEFVADFSNYVLVEFDAKPKTAHLTIGGEVAGSTPYKLYLKEGDYNISLYAKNYKSLTKDVNINKDSVYCFKLKRQYVEPSCFYLSGEYQFLGLTGFKGSIGGFINGVNIEANVGISFTNSETIYWNNVEEMTTPYGYQYKPSYFGARLGYGFLVGTRLRVTPQIGGGIVLLRGDVVEEGDKDPLATDGYCATGLIGLRLDFAVAPSIAITVTPNYNLPLVKSTLYSQLFESSKTIKGYVSGGSVSAGVCFFF